MKKIVLLALVVLSTVFAAQAHNVVNQVKDGAPRAIGLRVGGNIGASYQHTMSQNTFMEVDVTLPGFGSGLVLTAQHNWLMDIPVNEGRMGWYGGVGAAAGVMWSPAFVVGVVPQIGFEYIFQDVPVQLSLDYAPILGVQLGKSTGFFNSGLYNVAISVRYVF